MVPPPLIFFVVDPPQKMLNPKPELEEKKKLDPPIKFFLFMVMAILSASVKRFSVSHMQDFVSYFHGSGYAPFPLPGPVVSYLDYLACMIKRFLWADS